jgi:DNA-binding winged helix-turn-helix (wHTH) protein/tetratricopeptide (TPR) repeat protein
LGRVAALRFGRFELDDDRAELRRPDGETVRLRPKTLALLQVFLASGGRILSKRELMRAVWPNVHVGEDSLFQCIRELRAGLGGEGHRVIQLVPQLGYQLVEMSPQVPAFPAAPGKDRTEAAPGFDETGSATARKSRVPWRAVAAAAGACSVIALALAAIDFRQDMLSAKRPTVAVTIDAGDDPRAEPLATAVATDVIEGLSTIGNIRVLSPLAPPAGAALKVGFTPALSPNFVVEGRLQKDAGTWTLRAHATNTRTGEVRWSTSVSVPAENADASLQRSRLAGGLGHELAVYANSLLYAGQRPGSFNAQARANIVVEQATAFIVHTSRERFAAAQTMLENALAADPDNIELEATLAGHLLRGLQSSWYTPSESSAVERRAQALLERALKAEPEYLPALESYCRFLTATNHYIEGVLACTNALAFDPWDGLVRFNLGMDQVQLGHFAEALATFKQADRFDTPQVSRWTWLLGAGLAYMLMDQDREALPWLQRSLAITPGTGRTYILLAGAYQRLGRLDEARAAMAKALELRPGSTADNMPLPANNVSPLTIAATARITRAEIAAGLPEH